MSKLAKEVTFFFTNEIKIKYNTSAILENYLSLCILSHVPSVYMPGNKGTEKQTCKLHDGQQRAVYVSVFM